MPTLTAPPLADGQVAARTPTPRALPRDALERRVRPIATADWERGAFSHEGLARCGTAGQGVGCATGVFEAALDYAAERTQFGRPIGAFV